MNDFSFTTSISSSVIDGMDEDRLLEEVLLAIKNDNLNHFAVTVATLVEYDSNNDIYERQSVLEHHDESFDISYYALSEYLQKFRNDFYEKYKLLLG